jgi:hypothetical protein
MAKSHLFLSVPGDPRLGLTVNLPAALAGGGLFGLPPYARVHGHRVDNYPACPEDWPRSTASMASYFIPIREGCGMWLDFNKCAAHPHHVAIVVSIQGVNPLTGRKADKLEMERYPDDPNVEAWLRGRQNYLSSVATPEGLMWIDGFRAKDGTVRQYVFAKDESRGVAAQIIGVDRVFAIGVAFFLSKEPKPPPPKVEERTTYGGMAVQDYGGALQDFDGVKGLLGPLGPKGTPGDWSGGTVTIPNSSITWTTHMGVNTAQYTLTSGMTKLGNITNHAGSTKAAAYCANSIPKVDGEQAFMFLAPEAAMQISRCLGQDAAAPDGNLVRKGLISGQTAGEVWAETDRIEIAAGAEIQQELYRDTVGAEFWQAACAGIVAVSYAPVALVRKILAAGEAEEKEGFLEGLKVGN